MIKEARIAFGEVLLTCAAFDLSSTGARICLFDPVEVPEMVELRLPDGLLQPARRRWQQGTQVGLEFVGAAAG
ncbi:hypothetical protein H7965_20110 [Siccirubricoccus deserti]|uniref:PilZ domain-containing protein n=2 Tax=Siccirubricoccus deserti TaxID=2013562 RepID=A0A9X0R2J0_9PROT|nr:hypothetical protein [Siccirubricoccus deserti]